MMMMQLQLGSSSSSFDQENKIGIMGFEDHHHDDVVVADDDEDNSFSSDVSSLVSSDDESDDAFDVNGSSAGSSSPPAEEHALGDMSGLLQQLPSKRGLSKHFQGKSQSFTSLAKVTCLEDLAKPENPYNKKLKSCRSYVALSRVFPPPTRSASPKLFAKNPSSRASCSSLNTRPPTHPSSLNNGATTTSGFSNQTPLIV